MTVEYYRGSEDPNLAFWLVDVNGNLIDFSTGYAFEFKIGQPETTAIVTKTTGIAGAVGSGEEPTGTPNILITWEVDELDIEAGNYEWRLKATLGTRDRYFGGSFRVISVIG